MNLVVSADGDLRSLAAPLQRLARELDPAAAVSGVGLMSEVVSRAIAQPRLLTALLTAFAGIAVLLAAVGVYGVAAGAVAARTAEFGVRIALGATPRDVIAQVLRSNGAAIATGIAAGCGLAWLGTRYLATLLYAVPPWSAWHRWPAPRRFSWPWRSPRPRFPRSAPRGSIPWRRSEPTDASFNHRRKDSDHETTVLVVLLLCGLSTMTLHAAHPLAGKWLGAIDTDRGQMQFGLELKEENGKLAGTSRPHTATGR